MVVPCFPFFFLTGTMIMLGCLDIYHSYAIVFDKHYGGTMIF